jgi:hypothetical protein
VAPEIQVETPGAVGSCLSVIRLVCFDGEGY